MTDIKTQALHKAIKTLEALGAQFKIIAADGQEYGQLEIVKPTEFKPRRHGLFAKVYKEPLAQLTVGQTLTLTPPEGTTPDELRSAVSAAAANLYGSGSAITCVNEDRVEILRIA